MLTCVTVFGQSLLVVGSETLLAERAVEKVISAARHEHSGVEVSKVAAVDLDGNRFTELTGGSLFATTSVIVVQDAADLPNDLFDIVVTVASDPPPELALVIVHPGGNKAKQLLDRLKKAKIQVVEATPIKPWELSQFVSREGKRLQLAIDQDTAQAVVDAVGTDLRALAAAVSQLASDADGAPITPALVNRYFGGRADVTSFAVVDDVMYGHSGAALEKLRWALSTGVAPVLITSAMANALRSLGRYLDVRSSGANDYELARQIGVPPWKVKDLNRQARGWNPAAVAAALVVVAHGDADVKGASTNADYSLERMVLAVEQERQRAKRS